MTIGQRIAQKRKELGLSQEALGERMGVSRQAIYKWESDAALPEIDKLVSLSKLFSVSIGWILGVEEAGEPAPSDEEKLTPAQQKMAEEIAKRYIAALPQPKPRRKWPWILATCVTALVLFNLFAEMEQLNSRCNNLQNAVGNITNSVNMQINGIAGRVEEILKAQNDLTAEYGTEILSIDYKTEHINISMTAVPKTHVQNMQAVFVVDYGTGPVEFPGILADGRTFSAEASVPLTDRITMSVVFIGPDGTRQTQLLDTYTCLLSESYAEFSIGDHRLWNMKVVDEHLTVGEMIFDVRQLQSGKGDIGIVECKLGLFCNQKLIAWAEACDRPAGYQGYDEEDLFFRLPNISAENIVTGDKIAAALLVTDEYGRTYMVCDVPYEVKADHTLGYPDRIEYDRDPSKWILE